MIDQLLSVVLDPLRLLDILIDGVSSGAQYALFAAGLSLIFGIMRLVNLAHGDFIILAAYILFAISWVLGALGLPPELNPLLALLIAAPLLFALGYAVQRGVLNNTLGKDILPPLLVTFALSVILQNGLFLIFSPDTRSIDSGALSTAGINIGYRQVPVLALITVGTALAVIGGLQYLFFRTALGRDFRAVVSSSRSRSRSAILRSGTPDCCVPIKSPGPRNSMSTSANSNPSFVRHMVSSRRRPSLDNSLPVIKMQ